jgi:hypothetical protein
MAQTRSKTRYASLVQSVGDYGDFGWTDPDLAQGPIDSNPATIELADNGLESFLLAATNCHFDLSPNALITGITATVNTGNVTVAHDVHVVLWNAATGMLGTDDKANGLAVDAFNQYTYGSATDKWGYTNLGKPIRGAQLNDLYFGFGFSITAESDNAAYGVDSMSMTVYYQPVGGFRSRTRSFNRAR